MNPLSESHPFDEMVQQSEIRLAHASLLWARDEYATMTPSHYLDRLHALADRVDAKNATTCYDQAEAMRRVLVDGASFVGNYDDFANPENSFVNRVLDTHRGIPVSLSVVWLDVAEQLGWDVRGVALPGHFLIRYAGLGETIFVDPFNRGREVSREDCGKMVSALFGEEFELRDEHLLPAGTHAILARLIGNLYATYADAGDWDRTVGVLRRLVALRPDDAMIHAELGRILTLLGDFKASASVLGRAEELAADGDEAATVGQHLAELRARIQQQN